MSAGRAVEELLPEITVDRLDIYESLLAALADARLHLPIWEGNPGDSQARYGSLEVAGHVYVPALTSSGELASSGWPLPTDEVVVRDLAAALYPERWGLWLNPHVAGGGLGIPWPDLRRIADGLRRLPAGPLRVAEPAIAADDFYQQLVAEARRTPPLRSLRRAWVQPALGPPYLVIGVDVDDQGETAVEEVHRMMNRAVSAVPEGLVVGTVAMGDAHDPVAMWLWANARPFYDQGGSPTSGDRYAPAAPSWPGDRPG